MRYNIPTTAVFLHLLTFFRRSGAGLFPAQNMQTAQSRLLYGYEQLSPTLQLFSSQWFRHSKSRDGSTQFFGVIFYILKIVIVHIAHNIVQSDRVRLECCNKMAAVQPKFAIDACSMRCVAEI